MITHTRSSFGVGQAMAPPGARAHAATPTAAASPADQVRLESVDAAPAPTGLAGWQKASLAVGMGLAVAAGAGILPAVAQADQPAVVRVLETNGTATPRIASIRMGTGNFSGTVEGEIEGDAEAKTFAKLRGVGMQAHRLAQGYIQADGGARDSDPRPGYVEISRQDRENLYKGWRMVGLYDEEIWRSLEVDETATLRYDPATRTPIEFEGIRDYHDKEYFVDFDGREPALEEYRGTHTLSIRWGPEGDVESLRAVNLREDRLESVSVERDGGTVRYEEASRDR